MSSARLALDVNSLCGICPWQAVLWDSAGISDTVHSLLIGTLLMVWRW